MENLVIIRSIVGAVGAHYAFQCMTGRRHRNQPQGGWPSIGSTISKLKGPTRLSVPPFVGLAPKMGEMRWAESGQPGFLGVAHAPFKTEGVGNSDLILNGVSLERLNDRKALLAGFDRLRRDLDTSGATDVSLAPQDAANITDATYLLSYLFGGGGAPVAPFPDCGPGTLPVDDELGCANLPVCQ